jgi:hypothetical protein
MNLIAKTWDTDRTSYDYLSKFYDLRIEIKIADLWQHHNRRPYRSFSKHEHGSCVMRAYFHLPYRQTQGIVMAHANRVPNTPYYSTRYRLERPSGHRCGIWRDNMTIFHLYCFGTA